MLNDAGSVAAALAGTVLDGRPVVEVPLLDADEVAFGIDCDPDEVLPAWQAARWAQPVTGRWPVVVCGWMGSSGPGWLERLAAEHVRIKEVQAELRYATGDHTLGTADFVLTIPDAAVVLAERARSAARVATGSAIERELAVTARDFGAAPTGADVRSALGDEPSVADLQRRLLDWEAARVAAGAPAREVPATHLTWFVPADPCAVILLPVANGWGTLAHIESFEGGRALGGTGRLIAVVQSWHERFGAELVANWATMLQFVVSRPPATVDEAWPLALEQELVAPGTTVLPGVPLRRHAQALVGRKEWFLHDRP